MSKNPKNNSVQTREFGDDDHHVFFGYYDISPFGKEEHLLATRTSLDNMTPPPDRKMDVGYYVIGKDSSTFNKIGETTTWCWQQGCRLQWFTKNYQHVIYNKIVDGKYGCTIQDINTEGIIKSYPKPVYSTSSDGNWGLSLNFSRLQRLRPGYGYVNFQDETENSAVPERDGVWRINLQTGEEKLLFSIAEISQIDPYHTMTGAEHYFNHIQLNPKGNRFLFFHLWIHNGRRFSRLITADIDGRDKYLLIDEGMVSHCTWKSDTEILAYAQHSDTGCQYHSYIDRSQKHTVFARHALKNDGHPTYSSNNRYLLTDTYPDKYGEQHLLLLDATSMDLRTLGSFYRPAKYFGETRCDLHPRWSPDDNRICIDSTHGGQRKIYVVSP
ncbi:MAG: hypothetical protein HQ542_05690 [Bacteroidia bacterium]|nr:hypothetical protein [Bacteroidia bacterium]